MKNDSGIIPISDATHVRSLPVPQSGAIRTTDGMASAGRTDPSSANAGSAAVRETARKDRKSPRRIDMEDILPCPLPNSALLAEDGNLSPSQGDRPTLNRINQKFMPV